MPAEETLPNPEENTEDVARAWASELGRRAREIDDGRVQTISWETVRDEIRAELLRIRASKNPS